ncbi:MAG: hypothetical protein Q9215_004601 [Flavoplaca cf. flavocitrina]
MSDNPLAESIIDSAIHRVLQPNVPSQRNRASGERGKEDDCQEQAITGILQGVMDNLRKKHAQGGGSSAVTNGEGTPEGGQGEGERAGQRDPSLIQLLNAGNLPMPSQQPVKDQQQRSPQPQRDDVSQQGQDQVFETSNKMTETAKDGVVTAAANAADAARNNEEKEIPDKRPTLDEIPNRGTKRTLIDEDNADGAMDAQPREAKRVAT